MEGHHKPGGGFVAGLIAAAAIGLCALAYDVSVARQLLWTEPARLVGTGLLTIGASGACGFVSGKPFLTDKWVRLPWPGDGPIELGTPLLFDAGVCLVVSGVTTMVLFTLAEDQG
jgi:multicomponent Na+:H+ antiporter subunit B